MTLARMAVVLAGGLALLILLVIVQTEVTRLHASAARCEREIEDARQALLEAEMELARQMNPVRLRQRVLWAQQALEEVQAAEESARRTGEGGGPAAERSPRGRRR